MRHLALGSIGALWVGCSTGASPDPGLDAVFQIAGAQYRPGPFPSSSGGPRVNGAALRDARQDIGIPHEKLDASLATNAHAAIVGVEGYDGAWIVTAGPPDADTPGIGSLHATFGLSDAMPVGPFTILVASADATGAIGEPARVDGNAFAVGWPAGKLVIGLEWNGRADLDLHVVDALGNEAWSDDPNTWVPPPPGVPVDPNAYLTGGILDHDGNARCARDGKASEHFAWSMDPPPGEYVVRVETRSMCGDPVADWSVAVYTGVTFDSDGTLVGQAAGYATPPDVQLPHGKGAGVTALRFTIP